MTVYVVGSINADIRHLVTPLPHAGATVAATDVSAATGGKGANQAVAAAAAGAAVVMIGAVGTDAAGDRALDDLRRRGVDVTGVARRSDADTGRALVFVDDAGENTIVIIAGANAALAPADVDAALAPIGEGDVLLLQNEIPAGVSRHAAAAASAAGARVVWNAAPSPRGADELVTAVDVLVVNELELADVARLLGVDAGSDVDDAIGAVAEAVGGTVVCTLGADGARFSDATGVHAVAALPVQPVDTTAAGDASVGYLAAHLHLPLDAALRFSAAAGAITVTRPGAADAIPDLREVRELLDR